MKKYVYGFISIVVLLFGVTLTLQNRQTVDVNYYFGVHWQGAMAWVLFGGFSVGVVAGLLASLLMVMRIQRQLARTRKELRHAEQEINNLRALPIKDAI